MTSIRVNMINCEVVVMKTVINYDMIGGFYGFNQRIF